LLFACAANRRWPPGEIESPKPATWPLMKNGVPGTGPSVPASLIVSAASAVSALLAGPPVGPRLPIT